MSTTEGRGDVHHWFRARLDASASGLLGEAEQERFDRHAAECERCRRAAEMHAASLPEPDPAGHLPPEMLARWDRVSTTLGAVERRLVLEHLASCEECREDLRRLGFEPALAEQRRAARAASPARPLGERLRDWILGGTVGAAAAAAAALLIVPTLVPHEPQPLPVPRIPAVPPAHRIDLLAPAPSVPAFADRPRSGGAAPGRDVTLSIPPGTRYVQLPLPALYSGSTVTIDVTGPGGEVLAGERRDRRDLRADHRILFGRAGAALEPGRYTLRVIASPEAGSTLPPETLSTVFVLEHRAPR